MYGVLRGLDGDDVVGVQQQFLVPGDLGSQPYLGVPEHQTFGLRQVFVGRHRVRLVFGQLLPQRCGARGQGLGQPEQVRGVRPAQLRALHAGVWARISSSTVRPAGVIA